jgi:hypothetical protein
MNRLRAFVLVAGLLGSQIGSVALPFQAVCQEADECCAPSDACGSECAQCACCIVRAPVLATTTTSILQNDPVTPTSIALQSLPSSPPPAEILHVPKSS